MGVFIHPRSGGKLARFALKSVHILTELKKGVTGHNKATVQKQLYYAEVGVLGKVEMPSVCIDV